MKRIVYAFFICIFALFSCVSISTNEQIRDEKNEIIENLVKDYLFTRYDEVTALNISDRIELQKQYITSDCELGFDSASVKEYYDEHQAESIVLYTTIDIQETLESYTPVAVEVAVAFYPIERENAYIAIYNYNINVICDNDIYFISALYNDNTVYVDTYGQDIHISENKIVAIGDHPFELESEE